MSNLPPNPYVPGPPQLNANAPLLNHSTPFSQVPSSHLPPGYMRPDANSNSPLPPTSPLQNSAIGHVNNYNQSGSNSPAFNHSGMVPPTSLQSSPMRPPTKPTIQQTIPPSSNQSPLPPNVSSFPPSSVSQRVSNANASPTPYPPSFQTRQINDNAPPLISSSHSQPLMNGPPMPGPGPGMPQRGQYPVATSAFGPSMGNRPISTNFGPRPMNPPFGYQGPPPGPPISRPTGSGSMSQPNVPFSGPPLTGPPRNSPLLSGPPTSGPPTSGPPVSGLLTSGSSISGPSMQGPSMSGSPFSGPSIAGPPTSGPPMSSPSISGPPMSGPPMTGPSMTGPSMSGPPMSGSSMSGPPMSGPPMSGPPKSLPPMPGHMSGSPMSSPPMSTTGPPLTRFTGGNGPISAPQGLSALGPPKGPGLPPGPMGPTVSGPQAGPPMSGPPTSQSYPGPYKNGPPGPPTGPMGPKMPQNTSIGQQPINQMPPMGHQMGPPQPPGLPSGPTGLPNNMPRYPQMPQGNYINQQPLPQPQTGRPMQQYDTQGLAQQMGRLSVTKQGFDQLWGHQMQDLLTCRHVLPEYPEDPPEIRLPPQFADSSNCSPEIFRCTVNRIPETNNLLQKSRLPLGILIHPFKDLNHLPVIQCTTIVRCRACRTYINPFVYFVDSKRWKCNLCYRVNDLPEEFQYDPVSRSYGDPSRRPEIKSATIEFIAPGEYMLRPPQPAVYLFLLDVSHIARDSGYLHVLCETLKNNLDQLPGDARTQVGFICYDAHVHYYLMSDGLTRPKEMTVIDIDDVFLPSPESLLVNLGERRDLVKELLTVLPQRHSGPGVPSSALGAALQAAYKLMAPTGGRITVFQTCLPNVGPGALQPREDPNARSASEVSHLNPATDFYKRLALDCSGAQIAVDLFLLNSQYADLATLSGMSKFSGGSVYHIPLFRAARAWQADQLTRMLTRYLTRKIGFEAVMRVRCTRGIAIHTFHGNFFVRSTDLLSLPNVSPDAGFGMQLTIEESLADLQQVCFQAALLYTSSKGERRIRVHTLALPIASNLSDVLHSADQHCIIGLLSKMAVDRCASASMPEAREALINVAVDALAAYRLVQNMPGNVVSAALHAPASLRLLPLYLLALLKRKAFRSGLSTRLDDRVADMCDMKTLPLPHLLRRAYPDFYPIHTLRDYLPSERTDHDAVDADADGDADAVDAPDPPRLHLSAERINSNGAYLLDDGETIILYICHAVSPAFLSDTFGVAAFSQLPDEARSLPRLTTDGSVLLHAFIDKLNDDKPYASNILVLRDNSPNKQIFTERLVDDRVESMFSYYEFLQHIKILVK